MAKIVCVTGTSSGIGESLAKELVRQGYIVIGLARRKAELERIRGQLPNGKFFYYECDVSNETAVKNVYNDLKRLGQLPHSIICAAGMYRDDIHPGLNESVVKETMAVNFFGTMNVVNVFLPEFEKEKQGHFVALSSIAAWRPSNRGVSYSASKAAIAMAFRGLNLAMSPKGIRFSTAYLGPVKTAMWEGKESWIVASPEKVARRIVRLLEHPRAVVYIPFISTTLSRLATLIPDCSYAKVSSYLFK